MTEQGGTNMLAANEALALEPEEQAIPTVRSRRPSRPIKAQSCSVASEAR